MFPSCLGLLEICQWGFIDVVVADKDRIDQMIILMLSRLGKNQKAVHGGGDDHEGKPCTWLELRIILVTEHRMHVGKTTADHTVPLVT